ncbi:MAG: gamma-glutamyl-gamma-aminobutyrate hydrolase family protein [Thermomicrobia bacterium]|nr:gamma-glutamyl-gamma-aminobutyrate hydrolase family protein [Thermomicrobia bacterium]
MDTTKESFARHHPKPAIGVLVSLRPSGLGDAVDAVVREFADRALRALEAAGGAPALIDISADARPDPAEVIGRCAGLVILGGADIDPTLYGDRPHPATNGVDPDADRYEIAAVHVALDDGTPIVGICRGMQVINVACGGTLVQDLGAETPHHGPPQAIMVTQRAHIDADSRLGAILGRTEIAVRTGNHQAVERVAHGFTVVGRADDGVIEAIEHATAWVVGVQWHPEDPLGDAQDLAAIAKALVHQAQQAHRASDGSTVVGR